MGWKDDPFWDNPQGRLYDIGSEPKRKSYRCKHCGMTGLRWVKVESGVRWKAGWKLYEGDKLHCCKTRILGRNYGKPVR